MRRCVQAIGAPVVPEREDEVRCAETRGAYARGAEAGGSGNGERDEVEESCGSRRRGLRGVIYEVVDLAKEVGSLGLALAAPNERGILRPFTSYVCRCSLVDCKQLKVNNLERSS